MQWPQLKTLNYLWTLPQSSSKMLLTFFSLFVDGARTADWCKEIRLDKTENIELTIKKSNDSRANYQEWWWQTISKNALYKYTHRTEVHPGTEYLHRNNYNWSNKILFAVSIQVAGFYIGSPSLSQPFRGFAHQKRQEKKTKKGQSLFKPGLQSSILQSCLLKQPGPALGQGRQGSSPRPQIPGAP